MTLTPQPALQVATGKTAQPDSAVDSCARCTYTRANAHACMQRERESEREGEREREYRRISCMYDCVCENDMVNPHS